MNLLTNPPVVGADAIWVRTMALAGIDEALDRLDEAAGLLAVLVDVAAWESDGLRALRRRLHGLASGTAMERARLGHDRGLLGSS